MTTPPFRALVMIIFFLLQLQIVNAEQSGFCSTTGSLQDCSPSNGLDSNCHNNENFCLRNSKKCGSGNTWIVFDNTNDTGCCSSDMNTCNIIFPDNWCGKNQGRCVAAATQGCVNYFWLPIQPSTHPSDSPSRLPSSKPSMKPSREPSIKPSGKPSASPTNPPSGSPSIFPSIKPSSFPSDKPSLDPSSLPSQIPSKSPNSFPSGQPSKWPSDRPSNKPNTSLSFLPSILPSERPSYEPNTSTSNLPSIKPSSNSSKKPSEFPSSIPSEEPSKVLTPKSSNKPSDNPSFAPIITTGESSGASLHPSTKPTLSFAPFSLPSGYPSLQPSFTPSSKPSQSQSVQKVDDVTINLPGLTTSPSANPSSKPISFPSHEPSPISSEKPSIFISDNPSVGPNEYPSLFPSFNPSKEPSSIPSVSHKPSSSPYPTTSISRSRAPSASFAPTGNPSLVRSRVPSTQSSMNPTETQSVRTSLNIQGRFNSDTMDYKDAQNFEQALVSLLNNNFTERSVELRVVSVKIISYVIIQGDGVSKRFLFPDRDERFLQESALDSLIVTLSITCAEISKNNKIDIFTETVESLENTAHNLMSAIENEATEKQPEIVKGNDNPELDRSVGGETGLTGTSDILSSNNSDTPLGFFSGVHIAEVVSIAVPSSSPTIQEFTEIPSTSNKPSSLFSITEQGVVAATSAAAASSAAGAASASASAAGAGAGSASAAGAGAGAGSTVGPSPNSSSNNSAQTSSLSDRQNNSMNERQPQSERQQQSSSERQHSNSSNERQNQQSSTEHHQSSSNDNDSDQPTVRERRGGLGGDVVVGEGGEDGDIVSIEGDNIECETAQDVVDEIPIKEEEEVEAEGEYEDDDDKDKRRNRKSKMFKSFRNCTRRVAETAVVTASTVATMTTFVTTSSMSKEDSNDDESCLDRSCSLHLEETNDHDEMQKIGSAIGHTAVSNNDREYNNVKEKKYQVKKLSNIFRHYKCNEFSVSDDEESISSHQSPRKIQRRGSSQSIVESEFECMENADESGGSLENKVSTTDKRKQNATAFAKTLPNFLSIVQRRKRVMEESSGIGNYDVDTYQLSESETSRLFGRRRSESSLSNESNVDIENQFKDEHSVNGGSSM